MAIGDTVQAGLLRADFSPIQKAGQAQAKANQAFGQTLGGLVDKFYQKKKEKAEKEQLKQAYLKLGMSEEVADAAKNDKDLAGQFINKMNADRNYDLQMDQFNQVGELRDLQKDQIAQNMARQEDADQLKDEKRMVDNQFMQSLMSQTTSPQAQRQADIARCLDCQHLVMPMPVIDSCRHSYNSHKTKYRYPTLDLKTLVGLQENKGLILQDRSNAWRHLGNRSWRISRRL